MKNRLNFVQASKLCQWMLDNEVKVRSLTDRRVAEIATSHLQMPATKTNIESIRMKLGWRKRATPKTLKKGQANNQDNQTNAIQSLMSDLRDLQQRIGSLEEYVGFLDAEHYQVLSVRDSILNHEREKNKEKQRIGIERAKAQGKYRGRPMDKTKHSRIKKALDCGLSVRKVAKIVGVSTATVQRHKELNNHVQN